MFARRRGHRPGLERAISNFSRTGEHAAYWLALGLAGAMVREYAMGTGSASLPAISDGAAESTRRVLDAEVRELADEAFRSATALLDSHRPQLDALASTLLTNEVLERDDISRVMGDTPPAAPRRIGELSVAAATAANPAPPARRKL